MNRSGLVTFAAAVTCVIGLGSSALGQTPQPAPAAQPAAPPPAAAPGAPPRAPGAAAQPRGGTSADALRRPPSYRTCLRTAKRKGLRGSVRRAFITRCRLGREPVIR